MNYADLFKKKDGLTSVKSLEPLVSYFKTVSHRQWQLNICIAESYLQ
jgi:hypothetical protein